MAKFIDEWKKQSNNAYSLLKNGRFSDFEKAMQKLNESYSDYKQKWNKTYRSGNFGFINKTFEKNLPNLLENDKSTVKKYMEVVKKDPNLITQLGFYKSIEKFDGICNPQEYITECVSAAKKSLNQKTIEESNKRLFGILYNGKIKFDENFSDEEKNMYESCHFLLKNEKKITNINECKKNEAIAASYISDSLAKKQSINETFEAKYKNILNEEEMNLVKTITDIKNEQADVKKKSLFDKFKNECIGIISNILSENCSDAAEEKRLNELKETLELKEYSPETIVEDFAKLLQFRDVLLDK